MWGIWHALAAFEFLDDANKLGPARANLLNRQDRPSSVLRRIIAVASTKRLQHHRLLLLRIHLHLPPGPRCNSRSLLRQLHILTARSPYPLIPDSTRHVLPYAVNMPSATGSSWEKYQKNFADDEIEEKKITPLTDEYDTSEWRMMGYRLSRL